MRRQNTQIVHRQRENGKVYTVHISSVKRIFSMSASRATPNDEFPKKKTYFPLDIHYIVFLFEQSVRMVAIVESNCREQVKENSAKWGDTADAMSQHEQFQNEFQSNIKTKRKKKSKLNKCSVQ